VGRVLGWPYGILVFLLDFAKGAVSVGVAAWLETAPVSPGEVSLPPGALPVLAGLAAFLGHLYPVYLRFQGGKGVATGAGVVAVLLPGPALGAVLVWLAVICATRYSSLASMTAALALCLLRWVLVSAPLSRANFLVTAFCLVAAGLVVLRHHANIRRLLRGNENRFKDSLLMMQLSKVLHLLALGLWFGSGIFFTFVVALVLFNTFERLGNVAPSQRPAWLPLATDFHKEDGTKLAGAAVGPIFPWYFLVQGACGLLALGTALGWNRLTPGRSLHRLRSGLLLLAVIGVLVGWPLAQRVSELRVARYLAEGQNAADAQAAFAAWHPASLGLNLFTLLLVTGAMVLAAWLPSEVPPAVPPQKANHAS
jgi:acyl-phosphate glycerol 3-phosphate acyltransferase